MKGAEQKRKCGSEWLPAPFPKEKTTEDYTLAGMAAFDKSPRAKRV